VNYILTLETCKHWLTVWVDVDDNVVGVAGSFGVRARDCYVIARGNVVANIRRSFEVHANI
jgi:hypothetical protein